VDELDDDVVGALVVAEVVGALVVTEVVDLVVVGVTVVVLEDAAHWQRPLTLHGHHDWSVPDPQAAHWVVS
jgi:hypothetical protein